MPHTRSLFRVGRRVTSDPTAAEDLVQETMLLAWRGFDQFLPGSNARAWLFRIMFNAHYSAGRKMQAAPVTIGLSNGELPSSQAGLSSSVASSMIDAMDVAHALADLAKEHRTVLMLGVVEGFTCREIAEILSLPIGTVMSRLSRARQALRARLAPAPPGLDKSAPGLYAAAPRLCEAAPSTKCAAREPR